MNGHIAKEPEIKDVKQINIPQQPYSKNYVVINNETVRIYNPASVSVKKRIISS